MSIEEYNKKLSKVVQDLKTNQTAETMVKIGLEAKRLIFARVHDTGIDAKGKKYAPYSRKDTLVGNSSFAFKKGAERLFGSKDKRKQLEWRTVKGHHLAILKGGYAKIRELQDRQTAFVDFSVTQRMWTDINVIKSDKNTVVIGAKEELNKKKLAGNTRRKGDILDLNKKEIEELQKTYNLGVLQIFKDNGL